MLNNMHCYAIALCFRTHKDVIRYVEKCYFPMCEFASQNQLNMVKCRKERPGGWDLNISNILLSNLRKPLLRRATAFNRHSQRVLQQSNPSNLTPGVRMSKAACHHAVSVVKGQESYTLYNTSFRNIFNSINAIAASKCLDINGEEMAIDVYLGGDYKFLLMAT